MINRRILCQSVRLPRPNGLGSGSSLHLPKVEPKIELISYHDL